MRARDGNEGDGNGNNVGDGDDDEGDGWRRGGEWRRQQQWRRRWRRATATRAMARATAVVGERRWQWSKAKDVGEGGKSDRDDKKRAMAWKRAMLRAARAMATATKVGDEEDEGVEESKSFYS
jgi:hypothetical protein